MSDHKGLASLFTDRKIGTKIAAGFGVILLILTVSSSAAYLAFEQAADAVGEYTRLVTNSAIFRDIDLQVTRYRGHVREYVRSDNEQTADTAIKDGGAMRQLIAAGLARVTHSERHRLLEDAAKQADLYATNFEHVRAMNLEQAKLESDTLDCGRPTNDRRILGVADQRGQSQRQWLSGFGRRRT